MRARLTQSILGTFVMLALFGCGKSPVAPGAPAPTIVDDVVVSLDFLDVIRNCAGTLQYKFYVVATESDGSKTTYLTTDYITIVAADGEKKPVNRTANFQIERRVGQTFDVRCAVKALDSRNLEFTEGRFYFHDYDPALLLWEPTAGYDAYNNAQQEGTVVWEMFQNSDCRVLFEYQVRVLPGN